MAVQPVIQVPDPILTTKCEKVTDFDTETKNLIKDLIDTLRNAKDPEGAGLAAPQIGILKRVCIAREFIIDPNGEETTLDKEVVLVNPKIISESKDKDLDYEACLSIKDTYGLVERAKKIKVKAQNENGETIRFKASGYFARVIQHEIDHLDGILFTSKLVGPALTEKDLEQEVSM